MNMADKEMFDPSSSSCRAASMDIPDPLSPLLPIVHRVWQVFRATSRIPHIAAGCIFELVVLLLPRPYVGVHRSTSLMNSSLLLQQWPACLVRLTWIVFMMGGRWSYSWCRVLPPGFVQYCSQHFCVIAV